MDIIDTSIRVGQSGTGSREKLHPKQDYDEEAVIVFLFKLCVDLQIKH